jgi:hypothetical protein
MTTKIELLKKEYPELFFKDGKETCRDFSIGDGWIPIVRCLCESFMYEKRKLENKIFMDEFFTKKADLSKDKKEKIEIEIETMKDKIKSLTFINIVQIKEKFGGLRLYTNKSCTERQEIEKEFAYSLSFNTCEECGKEGTTSNSGWIRTLCEEHRTAKGKI